MLYYYITLNMYNIYVVTYFYVGTKIVHMKYSQHRRFLRRAIILLTSNYLLPMLTCNYKHVQRIDTFLETHVNFVTSTFFIKYLCNIIMICIILNK